MKFRINPYFFFLLTMIFLMRIGRADDLYFTDGKIFKNIKVLREEGNWIFVQSSAGERKFHKKGILRIEESTYDPNRDSEFFNSKTGNLMAGVKKPFEDGLYLGVGIPYLQIGGEFEGDIYLVSEEGLVLVPEVDGGWGLGFIVGVIFQDADGLGGGVEISYLKSGHTITWEGLEGDADYTIVNLDLILHGKSLFTIASKPARALLRLGLSIPSLKLKEFGAVVNQFGDVEIADASL